MFGGMLTADRIEELIRDALELPDEFELAADLRPAQVPGWDSLAWLNIITAVESHLGTELPLDALDDVSTVGDLYTVLCDLSDRPDR